MRIQTSRRQEEAADAHAILKQREDLT